MFFSRCVRAWGSEAQAYADCRRTNGDRQVIGRVVEWYKPGAIVLQCGADSLAGDKIGPFNMSLKGEVAFREPGRETNSRLCPRRFARQAMPAASNT